MRLVQKCPKCSKNLELVSTHLLDGDKPVRVKTYKCGHFFIEDATSADIDDIEVTAANGEYKLRPYQADGVKFIIESDFNAIIGDQMRLGKTPQALMALRNRFADRTPCLIIVRAANLWQWVREVRTWVSSTPNAVWVIQGTKMFIPPGFSTYIVSMDTFSRDGTCKRCKHPMQRHNGRCKVTGCSCNDPVSAGDSVADKLREIDFKLVIADEAHSFKNTDSNRSQALVNFLKEKNTVDAVRELYYRCPLCKHDWTEQDTFKIVNGEPQAVYSKATNCPKCDTRVGFSGAKQLSAKRNCGVILLTGTAIKNRADEYFVPLNLVAPTVFPSIERFRRRWLMQDSKGAWSRINPYSYDQFKSTISPYVLRREKEDVYSDLPKLNRMFTLIEPQRDALVQQYNKVLDKIDAKMADRINPSFWDYKDDMMELRKICGLMKVMWTADYAESCLLDSDNLRVVIGIHHYDVSDILRFKLAHIGCLKLDGRDNPERKDWIMTHFQSTPEQILVMNMLAGGVGMDFPYVQKIIILERQWSFADEEQFEFRFYNPDKNLLAQRGVDPNKVTDVEYILVKGSFEEFWYNMVEVKRVIQGQTIGTNWDVKTTPGMFKELLQDILSHRL